MLAFFRRKAAPAPTQPKTDAATASASTPKGALQNGLLLPAAPDVLLATPQRQRLLAQIWQHTAVSRPQFELLYQAPIERYAALVQQFPASEAHHHASHGGMLDHGLEIVLYALKLRQSHLLPVGVPPEEQAAQSEAWTAAIAYAALTHDIGKIAVDLEVETADGQLWHPWHGPLTQPYRFRYRIGREHRLHEAAAGLLYHRLLDTDILDWLSGYPELWAALLHALAGQYEHAGLLGELVIQADQASVANALGGDPAKALAAPRHALQRKLLDGLRFLLNKELKLNQPQASDGWLTQDTLWLVSKTVSDKLRAHLLSQGMDGIPSSNTAVFNVLQEHGIAQPTPDGKAIWKATITSDTGWSHDFTLLRLAPALIWGQDERPAAFAGTVVVDEVVGDGAEGAMHAGGDSVGAATGLAGVGQASAERDGQAARASGANAHGSPSATGATNTTQPKDTASPGDDVMESLMQIIGVNASGDAGAGEPGSEPDAEGADSVSVPGTQALLDTPSMQNRPDAGASVAALVSTSAPASVSASSEPMTLSDNQPIQADRSNPRMGASSDVDEESLSLTAAATRNRPFTAASESTASIETPERAASIQTITDATTAITADSPGSAFITWLRHAILTRKILLNDAKALVHTVDDTIFLVSPGIFMRYAQEHPHISAHARTQEIPDWQWVQKQFEKSKLHRKQPDGLNIWTCEVTGPRKSRRLHGYLMESMKPVLDTPIPNNPFLTIVIKNK